MSLAQKAGEAGALLLLRKMWGALVNIGVMAYLARTLDQSDFGLVVIGGTLISFVQTIGLSGISEFIIFYSGQDEKKINNSVFWLNTLLTIIAILIIFIIAPIWSSFYEDERIINLIFLMLIGFSGSIFSAIPIALFRKSMDFKPLITIQTIFGTISQLSQVLFAFLGFGVYSLVLPNAFVPLLIAFFLFRRSKFWPSWDFGTKYWLEIYAYSKHVIGTRLLTQVVNEGDTLLIGKILGLEALGIYDIAFKLANIVNIQLVPIISNISLPVFAKNQNDLSKVRSHYLYMISVLAFTMFPIFGFLIIFGEQIIHLLYGPEWNNAILPFKILCLFAIFRVISSPSSGLFNALGKPQLGLYFNLVFAPILFSSILIGGVTGLIGVCMIVMFVRNIGSLYLIKICSNILNQSFNDFFSVIRSPLIVTMVTFLIIILLQSFEIIHWGVQMFLYIVTYFIIFRKIFKNSLNTHLNLIESIFPFINNLPIRRILNIN